MRKLCITLTFSRVWKDLTLSSNADQSRYRVWDYPIKEQYTHLFKTIQASGLAKDAEEGFKRVLADEDGTFAFIHDASEVQICRNVPKGTLTPS